MNKSNNLRILIHHHSLVYIDENNIFWLPSFFGRWVQEISASVECVNLILYQSKFHLENLDTPVKSENINLYCLGERKKYLQNFLGKNEFGKIIAKANSNSNILLIRGITPHQFPVWFFSKVNAKAFLLVGSLQFDNFNFPFSIKNFISKFIRIIRRRELHIIAKNNTLMMANSPSLVEEISHTLNKNAFFVPTNSIKLSEFSDFSIKEIIHDQPIKLLYCGRIDLKKGLIELFDALKVLNRNHNKYILEIIGDNQNQTSKYLIEYSSKLGISNEIIWHGLIPYGPELFKFYREAEIFLLPSYTEGFPHVIWEAMANCCPVITTSISGVKAIIENEKHALLVKPRSSEEIINAVNSLIIDTNLRKKIIFNAYYHAKNYSVESCATKLIETLNSKYNL